MLYLNNRLLKISGLMLTAGLLFSGCGDGVQTDDLGPADTGSPEEDVVVATQTLTFVDPDPAERPVVSGVYKVKFRYDDSADLPATVTVSMVRNKTFEPIVFAVDGSGPYSVDIDTTTLLEGNESVSITVLSSDERQVTAKGKLLVDNLKPLVEILDPTPSDGSNFIGGLTLRVRVSDEGNKVHNVSITIKDFSWSWPAEDGTTADVVDTRTVDGDTYEDLVVPVSGWLGGDMVLTVTADDGVDGHEVVEERSMKYVEVPGFVGGEKVELPSPTVGTAIAGIRIGPSLDEIWGVVVASSDETTIQHRVRYGVAESLVSVVQDSCTKVLVADMNSDGMDDIVAFCGTTDTRRIVIMVQHDGLVFEEYKSVPLSVEVLDLATGGLNSDDFPDIAFTNDDELNSTGVILSIVDDYGDLDTWSDATLYSGALSPEKVAVGMFSNNNRNAVVVGRASSGIVTVFPVNQDGVVTSGENSTLDPDKGDIDDVSGLAAVNFASMSADPDSLVVIDSTGDGLLSVAGLDSDSARVESRSKWTTGLTPKKIVVGDIDDNNIIDVVVLCAGANMVELFMGNSIDEGGYDYLKTGLALLSGAARDVTLADMDNDGLMDIVLLNRDGDAFTVIYYREDEGKRFLGSYQAVLDAAPVSMATGHFTQPLSGAKADFIDAAVLFPPELSHNIIGVYSSDSVVGMPITAAGSVELGLGTAKKLVVGNFNVHLYLGSTDAAARPDDLIVTSSEVQNPDDHSTAEVVLFNEVSHAKAAASIRGIVAGNAPTVGAAADFDETSGVGYDIMDVAFIYHVEGEDPFYLLQPWLGNMDGTFKPTTASGSIIEPMKIEEERSPVKMISFPMRRVLRNYVLDKYGSNDLIVANAGTGDFTVFVSNNLGLFFSKEDGSRDFAVGGETIDIAAGYLRSPIDGTADDAASLNEFPDVVTLLDGNIVISYSLDKDGAAAIGESIGFEPAKAIPFPGKSPVDVELADMNGDGYVDIVVLDRDSSSVWIYVNLGQQKFSDPYSFDTGTSPIEMSVVDVDADGCMDIVTADSMGKTLTSLRNTTTSCQN